MAGNTKKTHCVLKKQISAAHFHQFLFSITIIDVHKRRKSSASCCPCFHITYCSLCLAHSQFRSRTKIKTMVHGDKIIKILPIDAVDCWLLRRYLFSQLQRPIAALPDHTCHFQLLFCACNHNPLFCGCDLKWRSLHSFVIILRCLATVTVHGCALSNVCCAQEIKWEP